MGKEEMERLERKHIEARTKEKRDAESVFQLLFLAYRLSSINMALTIINISLEHLTSLTKRAGPRYES